MRTIASIFFLFISFLLSAQSNSRLEVQFISYQNALTGGFEAPQFQSINLNEDGKDDLLVFDRKGSVLRTFIYDETQPFKYRYDPSYEKLFPEVPCWLIVRDFNNDGIDDLFTCGVTDPVTGIELWVGSRENGELSFEAFNHPNGAYNIIYYEDNFDYRQLYVGNNGIPGIQDVDNDGDIDILAFQPAGGYMYYFKNMSQERGFGSDSLLFVREDECWGNFYEGGLIPDIILSDSNDDCAIPSGQAGVSKRHEGITVSIFDKNGDGLKDLLLGEVSSPNLIYIENGGTVDDAFATYKETNFPSDDVPVDINIFLASFVLDVDHDGMDDLLVAPNSLFGTNTDQVSLYQGVEGTFEYVQDDWLVSTTLDFGTDSSPAFLDYNADGLMDLVVGSFGLIGLETGSETRLYLFENIGSKDVPVYELVDDNYLDFVRFSEFDKSFMPSFGDLDGDGDVDLVLGSLSGELIYMENTAGAGNPVQFSSPLFDYKMLDTENNTIRTSVVDLNDDGLADIVVGGRNSYSLPEGIGSLKLFSNIGTQNNANFNNQNAITGLGGVNVKDGGTSKVSAAPTFYIQGDRPLLFVGNETGRVAVYEVTFDGSPYALISENILSEYIGRRVAVDVADIDNDGFLEIAVGNERGGLNFYNTVIQASGQISATEEVNRINQLYFYPNPAVDMVYFEEELSGLSIYNHLGQLVFYANDAITKLDLSTLAAGIYYISAEGQTGKLIKLGR